MKMYQCKKCKYEQDFDPSNVEKMREIFPEVENIKANQCPSCREEDSF